MDHPRLAEGEYRFACIVWEHEPLPSGKLVELSRQELGWKKSTTYTVLKKLSERGLFSNEKGTVVVQMPKEEFYGRQSEAYVERSFQGSLPGFLTAFTSRRKLSDEEILQLRQIIEESR